MPRPELVETRPPAVFDDAVFDDAVFDDLCLMTPLNSGRALAGSAINLQSTPCHQLPQTTTPANHAAPNFEAADES